MQQKSAKKNLKGNNRKFHEVVQTAEYKKKISSK